MLSESNGIQTYNQLVPKWTLNNLAKLASLTKWLSVRLQTKWLRVRISVFSYGNKEKHPIYVSQNVKKNILI